MFDSTRVTLSLDELITLKAAMSTEIRNIDQLVEITCDPHGVQAKNKAMAEALYKKLGVALKRV